MGFSTVAPKYPDFALQRSPFSLKQTAQMHTCYKHLVHNFGIGSSSLKQLLGPKLAGAGLRNHPLNFGTPYFFLQALNLTISQLVHNWDSGKRLSKNNY